MCAGEQSDYAGIEKSDVYHSLDLYHWWSWQSGKKDYSKKTQDYIRDVKTVSFMAWEDAIKKKHPDVNLIIFACFPNCGCFSSMSKRNKMHIEKYHLKGGGGQYIWLRKASLLVTKLGWMLE